MSSSTPHKGERGSSIRPVGEMCGLDCTMCEESGEFMEVGNADEEDQEFKEVEAEDVENGRRSMKKANDPKLPCEADVREHNLTHLPFRSWCRHCVRGRGKELPHLRGQDQPESPEVHMDLLHGRGSWRLQDDDARRKEAANKDDVGVCCAIKEHMPVHSKKDFCVYEGSGIRPRLRSRRPRSQRCRRSLQRWIDSGQQLGEEE